jgi:hypothetical protein
MRWIRCAAACAIGWLLAAEAAAAPGPDKPDAPAEAPEVQEARDAFRLGVSLVKQGQWSDALAAFERSLRLKPDAVTAFNVGYCERALGRLTRARRSFSNALATGELPADKAVETRGYLAEIEARLARAVTTLSPPGATVAVDGRPLEAPAGGATGPEIVAGTRDPGPPEAVGAASFTLVLDPGKHVIVVGAPGRPDVVVTRDLAPGATETLALDAAPPIAPPPAVPAPAPAPPPAPTSPRRLGAYVAFGAGGVGAVVGAVFGGLAVVKKGNLAGVCPTRDDCASSSQGTIHAMNAFATTSTVGVVAAAAGVVTGTLLLVTSAPPSPAPRGGAAIAIGPGRASIRVSF